MSAVRADDYYPRYTYEDYCHWEDRWELIDGIAYAMSPAPMIRHQKITNKIGWQLGELLEVCGACQVLQPVDWKIKEDTVVQPDNLVICHEPTSEQYLTRAPEVIFEVLSPSTARKDLGIKFDLYEQEGVAWYFIIDPDEETAKVYRLHEGRYIKAGDFHDETFAFTIKKCDGELTFDFGKIWS